MKRIYKTAIASVLSFCLLVASAGAVTPADIDAMFDLPYERIVYALTIPDNPELLAYAWEQLNSMEGTFGYSDMLTVYTEALIFLQNAEHQQAAENIDILVTHSKADDFSLFLQENRLTLVADLYNYTMAKICESQGLYKEAEEHYQSTTALDANTSFLYMRRKIYPQAYDDAIALYRKGEYASAYTIFSELARVGYEDADEWRINAAKEAGIVIKDETVAEVHAAPEKLDCIRTKDNVVELHWKLVEGAQFYAVYRSLSQNGSYDEVAITRNTQYDDPVAPKENCYYKVSAVFANGEGISDWVFAPYVEQISMDGPQNFEYQLQQDDVVLTWDSVEDASRYAVYRTPDTEGLQTQLAVTQWLTHTDTYKRYKDYYYKVDGLVNNAGLASEWLLVEFTRPELSLGSEGDAVRVLQAELIERNYLHDVADGIFGSKTEKAVKKLQNDANLPQTGIADARTWEALYLHKAVFVPQSTRSANFYRTEPVQDPVELSQGIVLFIINPGNTPITQIVIDVYFVDSSRSWISSFFGRTNSSGVRYYTQFVFTLNLKPSETATLILPNMKASGNAVGAQVMFASYTAGGSTISVRSSIYTSLLRYSTMDTWTCQPPDSWEERSNSTQSAPSTSHESSDYQYREIDYNDQETHYDGESSQNFHIYWDHETERYYFYFNNERVYL